MANTTTYEPGYPVNFYSGGDTTREAFGKHIQEILKIYGILNALQSTKADSTAVTKAIEDAKTLLTEKITTAKSELTTALNNHINSTDPHPNLQIATLKGNFPASRLSGQITNSQIDSISGNKITGSISTDKIDDLKSFVENNSSKPIGTINRRKGYMQFTNGFTMQWDITEPNETNIDEYKICSVNFAKTFTELFAIYTQMYIDMNNIGGANQDVVLRLTSQSTSGFEYRWDATNQGAGNQGMYMSYLALGIIN